MKRQLPILFSLLLCHCGTEVGNGVAPETETATATPTASEGATNESSAPGDVANPMISTAFLAACASPFAEITGGTFVNGTSSFTVSVAADGSKSITPINTMSVLYTIKPAPSNGTYAIEALTVSPSVSCSGVTTQALSETVFTRSVTLSSGDLVQWTLTSGLLTNFSVTTATSKQESWVRKE